MMIKTYKQPRRSGPASKTISPSGLHWLAALVVAVACATFAPTPAAAQEEDYLRILELVEQADALSTNGPTAPALAKYQQAQTALRGFQRAYPDWNAKVVSYRLNYINSKLAAFSSEASTPAASSTGTSSVSRGAADASTPQVKLLEAGAEPRKVLRLHPKAGDKQTVNLAMKMTMETKVWEMPGQPMKMPEMKMTMDLTVKSVSDNGDIAYETVVTDATVAEGADVQPQVAAAMK